MPAGPQLLQDRKICHRLAKIGEDSREAKMIKVAVFGARGRMGEHVVGAVNAADDLELVAEIDADDDRSLAKGADVIVDFTVPSVVMGNIKWAIDEGIHIVVGTTGFDDEKLAQVRAWQGDEPKSNVLIASNFSIAAVLMMHFAEKAAPFFESVEIVELHHENKVDAPSGTAATTARRIAAAREAAGCAPMPDATEKQLDGARGAQVDGIHVHSVRLPGLFAHQEVILGNDGETLTIRDDSFRRASYMPGVLTAVRAVRQRTGLTIGIDELLGIS